MMALRKMVTTVNRIILIPIMLRVSSDAHRRTLNLGYRLFPIGRSGNDGDCGGYLNLNEILMKLYSWLDFRSWRALILLLLGWFVETRKALLLLARVSSSFEKCFCFHWLIAHARHLSLMWAEYCSVYLPTALTSLIRHAMTNASLTPSRNHKKIALAGFWIRKKTSL